MTTSAKPLMTAALRKIKKMTPWKNRRLRRAVLFFPNLASFLVLKSSRGTLFVAARLFCITRLFAAMGLGLILAYHLCILRFSLERRGTDLLVFMRHMIRNDVKDQGK